MTDTTQPPAETLAECPFCGADAAWREYDPVKPDVVSGLVVNHSPECFLSWSSPVRDDQSIRAAWGRRAALTRRAGGDVEGLPLAEVIADADRLAEAIDYGRRTDASSIVDTLRCLAKVARRISTPCIGYPAGGDAIPAGEVDWREIARLAGEHGVRYRTNRALLQFLDAVPYTPKPPADGDAPDELRDFASLMVDEVIAKTRIALDAGESLSVEDQRHMLEQLIVERKRLAALALPAPVVEGDAETVPGRVIWHTSEEGGGPDVGISVDLGNGSALWIGELLDRDGGPVGIVFHGPGGVRHAARLSELDEVRDLFEHHVAPAIAALSEGRSHG